MRTCCVCYAIVDGVATTQLERAPMDNLQFTQIQKELSNLALRLIHMEASQMEKMDELIEVMSSIGNEIRDLKAEIIASVDVIALSVPAKKG
jgi:hypothetical protein